MPNYDNLLAQATAVLEQNDRGDYTQPAAGLYPHQWLWDSCFTAIGLVHLDVHRAQKELVSLLRGQWHNGMLPNIIFRSEPQYWAERNQWRSWLSPHAPEHVATTGITQPPLLAEAVVRVGDKLDKTEKRIWYRQMYPALLKYHQWLYNERDPHGEGLILLIHPWECGMDNTPPWIYQLHQHQLAWWVSAVDKLRLSSIVNKVRRDTKSVPAGERFSTIEALALLDAQLRLRRKAYDTDRILDHALFSIEDVAFNSMVIRANSQLNHIAHFLHQEIPADLKVSMKKTEKALEDLWDPHLSRYYCRDFITHNLIKVPSMATLLPLYAGSVSAERAAELVKLLENPTIFGTPYPVPSVPADAKEFHPKLYWQGPSWVNMNWLIIDGLGRYGYADHAAALRETTLEMVAKGGCHEYFDPLDGTPAGGRDFSWTAALVIDLIQYKA